MPKRLWSRMIFVVVLMWLVGVAPHISTAQALEPIVYTIKFPAPDTHIKALASTEELDYSEALDWFGLRFAKSDNQPAVSAWKLEVREAATEAQKSHLRVLVGQVGK